MKSCMTLVEQAEKEITTLTVEEALALHEDGEVVMVDVRDVRELYREGKIPGAVHAPRGMLEFWIDPASPYHRDVFASGKYFVFYCALGWRSALAAYTAHTMGLHPVAHVGGGLRAWRQAGGPMEPVARRSSRA